MPKVKDDIKDKKHRAVAQVVSRSKVGGMASKEVDRCVDEVVPMGSGRGMQCTYEDLSLEELERDIEHRGAVAKIYVIERIIHLVNGEQDLAKVSGALRDLKHIATEANTKDGGSGWNEYVMAAIRKANRNGPVHIENQQININGANEGKDKH